MRRLLTGLTGWVAVGLCTLGAAGCGAGHRPHRTVVKRAPAPLASIQLQLVGSAAAAYSGTWTEYGAKPLHKTLTVNALSVYNRGHRPLTLLGIRQARPVPGLTFKAQLLTTTAGFSGFTEQVNRGTPAAQFHLNATFRPLAGYVLKPNPQGTQGPLSPTLVLTLVASRASTFHLGDWLVRYRLGGVQHTAEFANSGDFCAGAFTCPLFG